MFDSIKAISDVQKIKNGGKAKLSKSQIVNLIINLQDAKKNLSIGNFKSLLVKFYSYRSERAKIDMGLTDYLDTCFEIIDDFELIAPFELYNGGDSSLIRKESPEKRKKREELKQCEEALNKSEKALAQAIRDLGDNTPEDVYATFKMGKITAEQRDMFVNSIQTLRVFISGYPNIIKTLKENRAKLITEIRQMK